MTRNSSVDEIGECKCLKHAICIDKLVGLWFKARSHMTIGMTTGLQTYANYLAAHWLTVYQWS